MSETIADHAYTPEEHAPDPVVSHGDPTRPGKIGIWLFLASEIMFFIGILGTYIILRSGAPEMFAAHAHVLSKTAAGINTLVLIGSSLTVALAVDAAQKGNRSRTALMLGLTILCAFGFLVIKYIEYTSHFHENMWPRTDTYLAVYFTMTGLHALHVIFGMSVNGYFWLAGPSYWAAGDRQLLINRVENAGLFWHFVDIVWIFLFPVLYLL